MKARRRGRSGGGRLEGRDGRLFAGGSFGIEGRCRFAGLLDLLPQFRHQRRAAALVVVGHKQQL
jgi:hypothetical protein